MHYQRKDFSGLVFNHGLLSIATICALFLVSGCAKVNVKKVSDLNGPEGLRYYMPRPYVMVHEPFVVASQAFVVDGEMSTDGQYLLISNWTADESLSKVLKGVRNRKILASTVVVAQSVEDGEAQGAEEEPQTNFADTGSQKVGEGKPAPKGGIRTVSMSNDNAAYAVTPMKRYMDVIWLPDFSEQYAVTGRAGFGNSSIDMSMGQGWSLQGLDIETDNSAVVEPLLGFYQQAIDSLSTVVQTKLGVLPVPTGVNDEAQGAIELGSAASFDGGTPVSIKVTVVRMAAPGLYPILKESEFDAVAALTNVPDYILVPVPPLTRIAFNSYEVVVIEAAMVAGDSPLRTHQYPAQWDKPYVSGEEISGAGQNPDATIKALETSLNQGFGGDDSNRWRTKLSWKTDTRTVIATLSKTGTPPEAEDAAKRSVRRMVENRGGFTLEGDQVVVESQ